MVVALAWWWSWFLIVSRRPRQPPLRSTGGGGAGRARSWWHERLAGVAPVAPPRRIPARSLTGAGLAEVRQGG
jgi:hypothetical protein